MLQGRILHLRGKEGVRRQPFVAIAVFGLRPARSTAANDA